MARPSADRIEQRWANLRLIHLPIHASWLSQVVIYFSVVQRRVVTPNDVTDLDQPMEATFEWKFTAADLRDLLARIAAHQPRALAA